MFHVTLKFAVIVLAAVIVPLVLLQLLNADVPPLTVFVLAVIAVPFIVTLLELTEILLPVGTYRICDALTEP